VKRFIALLLLLRWEAGGPYLKVTPGRGARAASRSSPVRGFKDGVADLAAARHDEMARAAASSVLDRLTSIIVKDGGGKRVSGNQGLMKSSGRVIRIQCPEGGEYDSLYTSE
jgi:hypothetical protein